MSYEQANKLSLEEIPFMDDVETQFGQKMTAEMKNTSESMEKWSWMTRTTSETVS